MFRIYIVVLLQIVSLAFGVQVADEKTHNSSNNVTRKMFNGMSIESIVDINHDGHICRNTIEYYKKNFTAPGRRISEAKCLEYVWDTKFAERDERQQYCDSESHKPSMLDLLLTLHPDRYKVVVDGIGSSPSLCSYVKFTCVTIVFLVPGGRPAFYGELPHMGAVGWRSAKDPLKYVYKCGATLISESFMLTAAHCSRATRGDPTVRYLRPEVVRIGDKYIVNEYPEQNEKKRFEDFNELLVSYRTYASRRLFRDDLYLFIPRDVPIKRFITHKDYKSPKPYYDVAIIELYWPVSIGPLIRPACLWSSPDTSELDKLLVSGWGVVNPVTREATTELQVAEVNFIDNQTCDEKLLLHRNRNWDGLAEHQICAGFLPGGVDTCEGDSGGPLQVKMNLSQNWPMYYVVGVTSFGYGCALPDTPAVYVKTASFIDWIESVVWPEG